MLQFVALGLVALIGALLAYAGTKPDTFRVQRSASIFAPPENIFPHIDALKNWSAWSPWEKKDPAMKKAYSGASQGRGAVLEWDGNKDVGTGRMQVLESTPPFTVRIQLDFFAPFKAQNTAEFTLTPTTGSTQVTWAMYGPQPFMMKVMSTLMNMDQMVGKDFEEGLANLKALAEK